MIEILARGMCDGVHRYPIYVPRPEINSFYPAVPNAALAYQAPNATLVLDEARRRGWSVYPLLCPACAAEWRERLTHGQVDNPEHRSAEDGRGLPESGEGAQ